MLTVRQSSIVRSLRELTISSAFTLSQNADGDVTLSTAAAYGITQEQADVRYVQKTGDTMSGNLTINADLMMGATRRVYLDGGTNTYLIESGADTVQVVTGGTTRLTVGTTSTTASGNLNAQGTAHSFGTAAGGAMSLALNAAAANLRDLKWQTGGVDRWIIRANSTAETGSNAGTNFELIARDDAGAFVDSVLTVTRAAGGTIGLNRRSIVFGESGAAAALQVLLRAPAGQDRGIFFQSGSLSRWRLRTTSTAESGSDAGSNLALDAYNDAGSFVDTVLTIARVAGGQVDFARPVTIPATERFYLDGGTNTYIHENAADSIQLVRGGSAALTVSGNGIVAESTYVITLQAASRLYLDGGSNTYIVESSADAIQLVAGGTARVTVTTTATGLDGDLQLAALKRVYLDGGVNTYIHESAADTFQLVTGATARLTISTTTATFAPNLTVDGGGSSAQSIKVIHRANSADGMVLDQTVTATPSPRFMVINSTDGTGGGIYSNGNNLVFSTAPVPDSTSGTTRMTMSTTFLDLSGIGLSVSGTAVLSSGRALSNITGLTVDGAVNFGTNDTLTMTAPSGGTSQVAINLQTDSTPTYWHLVARNSAHASQPDQLILFWFDGAAFNQYLTFNPAITSKIAANVPVAFQQDVRVTATRRVYLDGGTDTYIAEVSAGSVQIVVDSVAQITANSTAVGLDGDLQLAALKRVYLDGGSNTYVHEVAGDKLEFVTGGSSALYLRSTDATFGSGTTTGDLVTGAPGGAAENVVTVLDTTASGTVAYQLYQNEGADNYRAKFFLTDGASWGFWSTYATAALPFVIGWVSTETFRFTPGGDLWQLSTTKHYFDGGSDTYITEQNANELQVYAGGSLSMFFIAGGAGVQAGDKFYVDSGSNTYLYEAAADEIHVYTGGSPRFIIWNTGAAIAVGHKFYFDGGTNTYMWESAADVVKIVTNNTDRATFDSSGVTAANFILSSDVRLKTNVRPLTGALWRLSQIGAYRYRFLDPKRGEGNRVGVLAHEVQKVLPEAVVTQSDGMLGVNYDALVPLLIEGMKEQQTQIRELQAQLRERRG